MFDSRSQGANPDLNPNLANSNIARVTHTGPDGSPSRTSIVQRPTENYDGIDEAALTDRIVTAMRRLNIEENRGAANEAPPREIVMHIKRPDKIARMPRKDLVAALNHLETLVMAREQFEAADRPSRTQKLIQQMVGIKAYEITSLDDEPEMPKGGWVINIRTEAGRKAIDSIPYRTLYAVSTDVERKFFGF